MKRIASLAAIAALCAAGIAVANTASAAVAPPTVTAKMGSGSITATVSWKIARAPKGQTAAVVVERSDNGDTFTHLAGATRNGHTSDKPLTHFVWYRANVTVGGETSAWTTIKVDTFPAFSRGTSACAPDSEARAVAELNRFRATTPERPGESWSVSNRGPVRAEIHLSRLAQARAISSATRHGRNPHSGFSQSAYKKYGYPLANAGGIAENAFGSFTIGPEVVVQGWGNATDGHRKNTMWTTVDVGIGCALDSNGQETWIEDFGAVVWRPN